MALPRDEVLTPPEERERVGQEVGRAGGRLALVDEELRALEQRTAASPGDVEAAVRYGLALARAGERGRAALVLSGAVDHEAGSERALRALDSVAPGGLDPESPWPCATGDSRNTRRSWVRGPDGLKIVRRVLLERELDLTWPLVADGRGRLLTTLPGDFERDLPRARDLPVRLRDARVASGEGREQPSRLVAVDLEGGIEAVPGQVAGGWPALLPGWVVVGGASVHRESKRVPVRWVGPGGRSGGLERALCWVAGLGHVIVARDNVVEAVPLGASAAPRWRHFGAGLIRSLAIVPGPQVLVDEGEAFVWLDFITGARRHGFTIAEDLMDRDPLVGETGDVFFLSERALVARSAEKELWRVPGEILPLALAGERGDVLVTYWFLDNSVRGLAVATGRELWQISGGPPFGGSRVDGRGRIYSRRAGSLVVLDPAAGHELSALEIGDGWHDFAFAGDGLIALLRKVEGNRIELVVVGDAAAP